MFKSNLRIGFVPEHFSTPLHWAFTKFGLKDYATLLPVPSGTGHMIELLANREIDVGIGLTEGFVAGFAKQKAKPYAAGTLKIVGTYVESPLCWAISTGAGREDIVDVASLRGSKVGVSRMGSGSHIMSSVLADTHGWGDQPYSTIVPCGPFAPLRTAVNDRTADFFMWEHFTTKKFWDNGELKRIGEIYTPWSSWKIAARDPDTAGADGGEDAENAALLRRMMDALDQGMEYFREHPQESVEYICSAMEYSEEDAQEWMKGVRFPDRVGKVDSAMIEKVVATLDKAGVLDAKETTVPDFVVSSL